MQDPLSCKSYFWQDDYEAHLCANGYVVQQVSDLTESSLGGSQAPQYKQLDTSPQNEPESTIAQLDTLKLRVDRLFHQDRLIYLVGVFGAVLTFLAAAIIALLAVLIYFVVSN